MFIEVTNYANEVEDVGEENSKSHKVLILKDSIRRVRQFDNYTRIQSEIGTDLLHQDAQESYEEICLKLGVKSGN